MCVCTSLSEPIFQFPSPFKVARGHGGGGFHIASGLMGRGRSLTERTFSQHCIAAVIVESTFVSGEGSA